MFHIICACAGDSLSRLYAQLAAEASTNRFSLHLYEFVLQRLIILAWNILLDQKRLVSVEQINVLRKTENKGSFLWHLHFQR